jgi:TolB protein
VAGTLTTLKRIVLVAAALPALLVAQQQNSDELKVWPVPNLGEGAEFYFSPDSKTLIGNAKQPGDTSFHVYTINIDGSDIRKINAVGDDACSFFFPDRKHIVFTSTKDHPGLPHGNYSDPNDYPQGAELYIADLDGSHVRQLTHNAYYDAEVSVSPDGRWVLFTRQINGELDLWKVHPDGTGETQITHTVGLQEGGSFYLDDHTIIYRAWKREEQGHRPMPMQIYTINDDGTGTTQITHEAGTNWAPHPAPDKDHFVFVKVLPPRNFEVFLGSIKTGELRRLTFSDGFDGFPSISPDGNLLTFSSTRGGKGGPPKFTQYLMDISSLHLGAHRITSSDAPDDSNHLQPKSN